VQDEKYFLHGSDWLSIREARKGNKIKMVRLASELMKKKDNTKILFIAKTVL
jgi:hypothetical protein